MNLRNYIRSTHPLIVCVDLLRVFALLSAPFGAALGLRWVASTDLILAPLHRRLWSQPAYAVAGLTYRVFVAATVLLTVAWILSSLRTFVVFTLRRSGRETQRRNPELDKMPLPPWPYSRDSFALILGELQDRDGSRVPSERAPDL